MNTEFEFLRHAGEGNGAYEIWPIAKAREYMSEHTGLKELSTGWVLTDEKIRLVTRDYNCGDAVGEYFAAMGNPLASRVTPTIAVKRGLCKMTMYALRAYLQVMEKGDVFVHPPKEWGKNNVDYVAGCLWKASWLCAESQNGVVRRALGESGVAEVFFWLLAGAWREALYPRSDEIHHR